jgi:DNA gyrase/topoisomerase IV subunit B
MSAEQTLKFLDEIEHIKTRPGMYVGDVQTPRTLVRELVDNALDEYINGYADKIVINYDPSKGIYAVTDNGRGLPLFKVPELENQRAAKLLFLKLFSGGKFNHANYRFSAGLHGVGLTVVNALSTFVDVRVRTNGSVYELHLEEGEHIHENMFPCDDTENWSTAVTCAPSKKFFKSTKTQIDTLPLQLAKSMRPKGSISVNDTEVKPFTFKKNVEGKLLQNDNFVAKYESDTMIFELYFGWSENEYNYMNKGTVNLVPCANGWHERKAKSAIGKALVEISEFVGKPDEAFWGLRIFVNCFTQEPIFTSQSKDRLSHVGDEADDFDETLRKKCLLAFRSKSDLTEAVIKKIVNYKKQLEKLSDNEVIDSVVRIGTDKRKGRGVGVGVWECSTQNRMEAELYIVEGKSADGNVRKTRNIRTQAVLPLRGKPLNAAMTDDIKLILDNQEMVSLVNCIGVGIAPKVNMEGLRYGKIIIASDADADGAQISNLIIGALVYLVPELVEGGHVYEVLAPLYEQDGDYYYSLDDINPKKPFGRFKGLGSMNPDEVEKTIVDPKKRILRQVTLDDRDKIINIMQSSFEKKRIMIQGGVIVER